MQVVRGFKHLYDATFARHRDKQLLLNSLNKTWFLWIVWNRSICLRLTRNRPVACIDNLRETGWSCVSRHITIHSNLANQIVISACKLQPSVTRSPLQQDTVRRQYVCNLPMYKEKKERKGQTKCPESFNTTNLISAAVLPHYIWAFLTLRCV